MQTRSRFLVLTLLSAFALATLGCSGAADCPDDPEPGHDNATKWTPGKATLTTEDCTPRVMCAPQMNAENCAQREE